MPPDLYLIACHVWQTVQYCQGKLAKEGVQADNSLAKTLLRESHYVMSRIGGFSQVTPLDIEGLSTSEILLAAIQRLRWLIEQIEAMNYVK